MALQGSTPPTDDSTKQPVGAPTDDKPKVDPKYEGKTPEELITMLDERDKTIGEQGTRVGDAEKRLQALELTKNADFEKDRQAKAGQR